MCLKTKVRSNQIPTLVYYILPLFLIFIFHLFFINFEGSFALEHIHVPETPALYCVSVLGCEVYMTSSVVKLIWFADRSSPLSPRQDVRMVSVCQLPVPCLHTHTHTHLYAKSRWQGKGCCVVQIWQ